MGGKLINLAMRRKNFTKERHFSIKALEHEWKKSADKKSAGSDDITPAQFYEDLDANLFSIRKAIYSENSENFNFSKLKVVPIPKGEENGKEKWRIICIPTVRDRLIQRVTVRLLTKDRDKKYLNKKLELENNPIIYGVGSDVRPNSGVRDALKRAVQTREHYPWVLKTDIQAFFDRINRKALIDEFKNRFDDVGVLPRIVEKAINCECKVESKKTKQILKDNGIIKGLGIRQGMPLSPILSNFFLRKFDKNVRKKIGDNNVIRYADDIIVFAKNKKDCEDYKSFIEDELNSIDLTIPSLEDNGKTKIVSPEHPVTFLGMEISRTIDGKYHHGIDPKKFLKIETQLMEEFSFEDAIKNKITLSKLLQRFDSRIRGYQDAYEEAYNLETLIKNLEEIKQESQKKIMKDNFGIDIDRLSSEQKFFLGIGNL